MGQNARDAERFVNLKREVDEGFDEALAEVTAALAAVPEAVAVPLPGFEPAGVLSNELTEAAEDSVPDPVSSEPRSPDDASHEQLEFGIGLDDDPIVAFAPDPGVNWGPRRPTLRRGSGDAEASPEP